MTCTHRRLASALALAATLALGACSVPSDNEARAIDPARMTASASEKRNCTSPGLDTNAISARIYLVRQRGEPPDLAPVGRVLLGATQATPFDVLSALVNCRVTEEDKRNGFATALPGDAQLLGVDPVAGRPGVYEVRLSALSGTGGQKNDLDKLAVAQIFFTLTDPDVNEPVRELVFTVGGRAVAVSTDNRTVGVNDTVRRGDFLSSIPAGSSVSTTSSSTSTSTTTTVAPTTTARAATTTGRNG